jgi:penicillin-binding protein 1A
MPKQAQAKKPRRLWRRIAVAGGLFLMAAGGLTGWIAYREITANLPPVDKLLRYQLPVATRVYANDGTLLGEFYTEKRYLVPIAQIPPMVRDAFIAAEDSNFYHHKGVDVLGIVRAALANFTAGSVVQGGSTITQQVVKALLLTPEKSYERKAKEILLALRLERQLSKDEILYLYLNLIYLGNGAYGVGAAAQEYFDKDVGELSLAEASLLAGLPQAPSRYSPVRHWERAKSRQRYVLERMARERFVTWADAEQALKQPIELAHADQKTPTYNAAPYFVEHVRRFLEERYGGTAPYQLGLHVYTTCDPSAQRAAEETLRKGIDALDGHRGRAAAVRHLTARDAASFLDRARKTKAPPPPGAPREALVVATAKEGGFEVQLAGAGGRLIGSADVPLPDKLARNDLVSVRRVPGSADGALEFTLDTEPQLEGALTSIDLSTGYVRALVGGYEFNRSQFNRATQAVRQPGSSFKPFVFAAALDRGYTPASVIVDAPIVLTGAHETWMPHNFDNKYNGPTTLRDALTFSRNVVTVKLAQNVGLNYLVGYLPRFGFARPFAKNLSIALGTQEVTLFEMTRAYSVFANQGRLMDPIFITKITDPHGTVLEEFKPSSKPVISPETSYLITSMLESVVQRGTGRRVLGLGRPVAGKTGTTNDFHDAWFIGYTPQVVTGVWIGYDSERSLGKDRTGGKVAAPVFRDYMQAALGESPITDFPIPEGITFVSVERDTGRPASPDSTASFLEAFKTGSEPRYREDEAPAVDDDLERSIGRMRARGDGEYDNRDVSRGAAVLDDAAPPDANRDEPPDDEVEWGHGGGHVDGGRRAEDDDYRANRAARARPRAEDYLSPLDDADHDRPATRRRRGEAEAGDYRTNQPRHRRDIIEEELD